MTHALHRLRRRIARWFVGDLLDDVHARITDARATCRHDLADEVAALHARVAGELDLLRVRTVSDCARLDVTLRAIVDHVAPEGAMARRGWLGRLAARQARMIDEHNARVVSRSMDSATMPVVGPTVDSNASTGEDGGT